MHAAEDVNSPALRRARRLGMAGITVDGVRRHMRALTRSQDSVVRKLSCISFTIRVNLAMGTANVNVSRGTQGRAETSNSPNTARGRSCFASRYGYWTRWRSPRQTERLRLPGPIPRTRPA